MDKQINKRIYAGLLLSLGLLALSGCGGFAPPDAQPDVANLTSARWIMTTLGGQPALEGTRVTLVFEDDDTAGGYAGCNAYGGPTTWTASGATQGEVAFEEIGSNAALCGDPQGVMEQEEAYLLALGQAAGYALDGDTLTLTDGAGGSLATFAADTPAAMDPSALVETQWELVTMNGVEPFPGYTLTLVFDSDSAYHGHAGCRDFSGEYGAEGDTIHFWSMGMSGDEGCLSDEAVFKQEHDYIDFISTATTYLLDGDSLTLFTQRGEAVIFQQAN